LQDADGLDLVKFMKEKYPDIIPVLMVSAAKWAHIEDDAKKIGVDKFLPKPLFPSSVADIISECLGDDQENADNLDVAGMFAGRRILLAEDVDINREIVLALLEPTLIGIDCAVNGREAVQMFTEAPDKYDMIFMDVQMPDMDGHEATKAIRALSAPRAKTIPIIAMTANVFREDVEKCMAAGMDGHIGKPLSLKSVVGVLEKYLPTV
jgi:CheY-like chemotaxis protein